MGNFDRLEQEFWIRGVEFILVELDLGLTFSNIALSFSKKSSERGLRNKRNARMAYDSVMRFLPLLRLTKIESETIEQKCTLLRSRLLKLGEVLDGH